MHDCRLVYAKYDHISVVALNRLNSQQFSVNIILVYCYVIFIIYVSTLYNPYFRQNLAILVRMIQTLCII